MLKNIFSCLAINLVFLMVSSHSGYSQGVVHQPMQLMFYNVENLFDTYDDTTKNDNDFLPGGLMRWTFTRYNKKINSIYKTIVAAGEWNPPSIVAFCEVENRRVVEDLIYGTYLSKFNYGILHEESPDQRGIDVCMIYRKDYVDIIEYKYWVPCEKEDEVFTSRSILYSKIRIGNDTLHIMINHWPSRRGGVLAAENLRRRVAGLVKTKTDSLIRSSGGAVRIILLGDFNCTPGDKVMKSVVNNDDPDCALINLSELLAADGIGTYRYLGIWEIIDQAIVSKDLLTPDSGLYTSKEMLRIFKPDFLLAKDPKYPGFSPLSTYRGYRYRGGYSDHLPILLDLKVKVQDQQE